MKNIETPRKKHAGKGIDGGFEKNDGTNDGGGGRKEREKNPSYEEKIFVGGANKSRKSS